jgi:hypothetical protein
VDHAHLDSAPLRHLSGFTEGINNPLDIRFIHLDDLFAVE